jgi:hypothetical protein
VDSLTFIQTDTIGVEINIKDFLEVYACSERLCDGRYAIQGCGGDGPKAKSHELSSTSSSSHIAGCALCGSEDDASPGSDSHP